MYIDGSGNAYDSTSDALRDRRVRAAKGKIGAASKTIQTQTRTRSDSDPLDKGHATGGAEVMTADRIEELRARDNVIVMERGNEDATPMDAVCCARERAPSSTSTAASARVGRCAHPRGRIAHSAAMRAFGERSHPRIFETVVNRHTTAEVFALLKKGIATQMLVERGEVEQEVALGASRARCSSRREVAPGLLERQQDAPIVDDDRALALRAASPMTHCLAPRTWARRSSARLLLHLLRGSCGLRQRARKPSYICTSS